MTMETPYELLKDDQKKQLSKNNKAKMTLYNALPRNIMDGIDIEDLTIEQYLELTQNHAPNVADVPTKYRDHLSPCHKSPNPPLDAKTNPYHHASQSPIHPKITKTPSITRQNEEQSNHGLDLKRKARDNALRNWEAQIDQPRKQEHEVIDIFNINAIADLGASVNIMSESLLEELNLANPKNANLIVEMADKTREVSLGIKGDRVKIKINKQGCDFTTSVSEHLNERPTAQETKTDIYDTDLNESCRIKLGKGKLGGQIREKTLTEEQEDPEKCGETKERAIIGAIINKLPKEWFSKVSIFKDDLEGSIDYLKPTLYDGFIDQ
ncbi:reverse transcriptase domain-containing protein [Tanacetum coccineum]